jgi:hypothetical protein
MDPYVLEYEDPVPILPVFVMCYQSGEIVPSGHPIQAHTGEDAIHAVGQKFSIMGGPIIRKTPTGNSDFCIQRQLK